MDVRRLHMRLPETFAENPLQLGHQSQSFNLTATIFTIDHPSFWDESDLLPVIENTEHLEPKRRNSHRKFSGYPGSDAAIYKTVIL